MAKFEEHFVFKAVPDEEALLKNMLPDKAEKTRGHMTPTEIILSQKRYAEVRRVEDNKRAKGKEGDYKGFLAFQRDISLQGLGGEEYSGTINGHKIFIRDRKNVAGLNKADEAGLTGTIEDEHGIMDLSEEEIKMILEKYADKDSTVRLPNKDFQRNLEHLISGERKEGLDARRKKALEEVIGQ